MVDLDKFICSMIWHSTMGNLIRQCLEDQGLEYKDGKLVRIQEKRTPVTIKFPYGKETVYMTDEQKDLFESSCKKPSTIKFDEPDIEEMVEEYKRKMGYNYYLFAGRYEVDSYKQGLKDMYRKIKGE